MAICGCCFIFTCSERSKKMKRKILSLIVVMSFLLCMFSSISYASTYVRNETNSIISPMYVPCPTGPGQCKMYPKGQGTLYSVSGSSTTLVFSKKFAYQCSQCHQAVVCEKDKGFGYLGTYYMFNPGKQLQAIGAVCYAPSNQIFYNSSISSDPYFSQCIWYY